MSFQLVLSQFQVLIGRLVTEYIYRVNYPNGHVFQVLIGRLVTRISHNMRHVALP